MKAYAIDELGQPGSVRDVEPPEPEEGEVRIRVAAASLNPFDAAVVQGHVKDYMEHRFPLIPGADASGTVDQVGPGVSEWAVGDDVFGVVGKSFVGEGTLAELAVMSTGTIARKPASLEHGAASTFGVAGVTALRMVDAIAPSEGDVVVAIGATGGVGSFLVQLASRRGGRVVAVASGANAGYARSLGASDVIDYTTEDVVGAVRARFADGIQGIADMARDKELVARMADQLRPGGHVASATGGADVEALAARGIGATNVMGMVDRRSLETLATIFEREELVEPELRTYPLDRAAAALEVVGTGHVRGKIVVLP